MNKCSPEAFAKCPTRQYCGNSPAECEFSEGSDCDMFNLQVDKDMMAQASTPSFYDPSQWRRYEFKVCHNSQALASVLNEINKKGWVLVTVTQCCYSYTVFFKRFISCQKKDDV